MPAGDAPNPGAGRRGGPGRRRGARALASLSSARAARRLARPSTSMAALHVVRAARFVATGDLDVDGETILCFQVYSGNDATVDPGPKNHAR